MIKRLRLKFICVIMAIVMLMLGTILGVVVHFTSKSMEQQSLRMMRSIAASPFQQSNLERPPGNVRLPYFTVQIGRHGELLGTSGGYFDLSDQEYVLEIAGAAMDSGADTGRLPEYHLRFLIDKTPSGYMIVFADDTAESSTLRNLVISSLLIFFGAGAVFLAITILLSHWVIKPVAVAWDQQRQFVADASHELKTPLAVIMSNAELLQGDDASEEERLRFSRNILSTSYQMRSLVENMLEMARVDNGTVKMQFDMVDFSQLVTDAALSFQLLFEEQDLGLSTSIQEDIHLWGSEQHLYQVLDVLLDNALKYSDEASTVQVTLSRTGRNSLLAVSSAGAPLSREDQKNIFKRFYRADKARARNGSYGLGLSIAESVVTAHKGRIWVQSEEGRNTFFVQLPATDHPGRITAKI